MKENNIDKFNEFLQVWLDKMEEECWEKKKHIWAEFIIGWKKFSELLFEKKQNVSYIEISILRSAICQEEMIILCFEAFDEEWLFGQKAQIKTLMPVFTDIFQKHSQLAWKEAKKYMGYLPKPIAKRELLFVMPAIDKILAKLLAENKKELMIRLTEHNIEVSKLFRMSVGEYHRFQYPVEIIYE